jgi:CTP synthase
VPGGFGERGTEGKIKAIEIDRKEGIPFLGICLGMQLACIEFARNVIGIEKADSVEFATGESQEFIIEIMEDQKGVTNKGGTMRLGQYPCTLGLDGTIARRAYGRTLINERHRHRYEFDNEYRDIFEQHGVIFSGNGVNNLVEIMELKDHPWFVGCQFHPEFRSKPTTPHPLFKSFIEAALQRY